MKSGDFLCCWGNKLTEVIAEDVETQEQCDF